MGRPGGYAVDCNDDYAYITVEREGTEEEKERMMKTLSCLKVTSR